MLVQNGKPSVEGLRYNFHRGEILSSSRYNCTDGRIFGDSFQYLSYFLVAKKNLQLRSILI